MDMHTQHRISFSLCVMCVYLYDRCVYQNGYLCRYIWVCVCVWVCSNIIAGCIIWYNSINLSALLFVCVAVKSVPPPSFVLSNVFYLSILIRLFVCCMVSSCSRSFILISSYSFAHNPSGWCGHKCRQTGIGLTRNIVVHCTSKLFIIYSCFFCPLHRFSVHFTG